MGSRKHATSFNLAKCFSTQRGVVQSHENLRSGALRFLFFKVVPSPEGLIS